MGKLTILRQTDSADLFVFSTSCFKFIQQKVEKYPNKYIENTQKSAEAGCLKLSSWLNFFFFFLQWRKFWVQKLIECFYSTVTSYLSKDFPVHDPFKVWRAKSSTGTWTYVWVPYFHLYKFNLNCLTLLKMLHFQSWDESRSNHHRHLGGNTASNIQISVTNI